MARYFVTWESDEHLWPSDSKANAALATKLGKLVQRAMKRGRILDFGIFLGGDKGYMIAEADAAELYAELQQYHPYVDFMVHEVLSIDEMMGTQKSRMQ